MVILIARLTRRRIPRSILTSSRSFWSDSNKMLSSLIPVTYLACASVCFYVAVNMGLQPRCLCMPFLCLFAGLSVSGAHYLSWPQGLSDLWSLSVVMWVLHVVSLLFFEEPYEILRRTNIQATSESSTRWHLRPAYKLLFNVRLLRAQREESDNCMGIRDVQLQNRYKFCINKLCRLSIIWLLHTRIEPLIYPKPFLPFTPTDFSPNRQVFIRRLLLDTESSVTLRETSIRACLAVRWIWIAIYEIEASHAFLAILFVMVVRVDTAEEWPPLFGSVTKAYSLRGFWGRFWHRIANRSYTNFGRFTSRRLFGFKPSTTCDKITVIFVIFLISGLVHSLVSRFTGDKQLYMLDTTFFILNFLGGGLEVILSKLLEMTLGAESQIESETSTTRTRKVLWKRMIGYSWVFCFFFCVVPKWQYPRAYEQLRYVERMKGLWNLLSVGGR